MRLKLGPRISPQDKAVKRSFLPSLDLQSLIKELGQVVENRRFGDHQGGAGGPGGVLQLRRGTFAREGNDREVLGGGILFEASEGGTDIVARGFQIGQDQHGFGLFRAFHKPLRVGNHLDPVIQVLQPVDDLSAGQQLLI